MASMRLVTANPPTILIIAMIMAIDPMMSENVSVGSVSLRKKIDPTSTIPLMAFAPDIKGVCKTDGTFDISSKPKKTAKTNR